MIEETRGDAHHPLVSVIVAVRNGERFLTQALESIVQSDYRPIEILVIDGQSTDLTTKIAKTFSLVRCLQQPTRGIAAAYNFGIQEAKGDFIAFLSHDDVWTQDKLNVQMTYLQEHTTVQYVTAKTKFFCEPGCEIPSGVRAEWLEGEHVSHIMETLLARKSVFHAIGLFNENLSTAEDVDWFARAKDHGVPMMTIPKVLLYKRMHDENLSIRHNQNNKNILSVIKDSLNRKHYHQS